MIVDTGTADRVKGDGLAKRIHGHAAIVAAIAKHAEEAHAEREAARQDADATRLDRGGLAEPA